MDQTKQLRDARAFANAFAEAFADALTQKLGVAWRLACAEDLGETKELSQAIHFRLSAAGGLQGECFVALEQEQVAEIGSKLQEQPASAFNEEQGNALAALLLVAMDGLSSALSAQFGQVSFKVERIQDAAIDEMLIVPLTAAGEGDAEMPVLLYFSGSLLAAILVAEEAAATSKLGTVPIDPTNLQLVMDVELNVSLRFGQCQLPLRDVLELESGSVIELDRDVDDPVELLLDGKVIARGEAVIVDGNYGLRITEIPEPIESHFVR